MTTPYEATEEQRDELVEQVAREIQLRGLSGPAVVELRSARGQQRAWTGGGAHHDLDTRDQEPEDQR